MLYPAFPDAEFSRAQNHKFNKKAILWVALYVIAWLRGKDLNLRPLGYGFETLELNKSFRDTYSNFEEGSGRFGNAYRAQIEPKFGGKIRD
jgi:hypothetical protein